MRSSDRYWENVMYRRIAALCGGLLIGVAISASAGNPGHCPGDCAVLYQQCIASGQPEATCTNRELRCLQQCCGMVHY